MTTDIVFALGGEVEWMHDASCAGADHELFFADSPRQIARAKAICSGCPVRVPCLADALERGEKFGVWGGKTGDERAELLRRTG